MRARIGTLCAGLLCSCASIMDPGPDMVTVTSDPPGATVYRDEVEIGVTPFTAEFDRVHGECQLRYELDGHKTVRRKLVADVNPWTFGNLLLGPIGLIGILSDLGHGDGFLYHDRLETIVMTPGEGVELWTRPENTGKAGVTIFHADGTTSSPPD